MFGVFIQVRMAEIFINVFGDKLAKENLVELNNLDRLPSPHQLQGKIILKGTDTNKPKLKSAGKLSVSYSYVAGIAR